MQETTSSGKEFLVYVYVLGEIKLILILRYLLIPSSSFSVLRLIDHSIRLLLD